MAIARRASCRLKTLSHRVQVDSREVEKLRRVLGDRGYQHHLENYSGTDIAVVSTTQLAFT